MPWRLIISIFIFALFLAFITFNLENKCDISFGFFRITDVPVFLTVFASFALGLVCALPLVWHIKNGRKKKILNENMHKPDTHPQTTDLPKTNTSSEISSSEANDKIKNDAAKARERFLSGRSGNNND